jgi:hypothetical protein
LGSPDPKRKVNLVPAKVAVVKVVGDNLEAHHQKMAGPGHSPG